MNQTAYERLLDAFRDQGLIVDERSGFANCQAPGHSPRDRSVRVTAAEGKVLFKCFSEPEENILEKLGLTWADTFDDKRGIKYSYDDGRVVTRTPDKRFYQSGNKDGNSLYRAKRVAEAVAAGRTVHVVEGEQDVHAVEAVGGVATCNAMGAGKARQFDYTPLSGGTVVIVADKDDAGEKHAREVAATLLALDCTVTIVNAAEGKDAADHIAAGNTLDMFISRDDLTAEARLDHILATATAMRDGKSAAAVADQLARNLARLNETATDTSDLGNLTHVDTLLDEWWEWVDTDPNDVRTIPSPWFRLNDVIAGGFQPKRLYLTAARPGAGKSLVLTNIAQHAATHGYKGALFSLEMDKNEIIGRIMAAGAEASTSQISRREVDDYNRQKLATYTGILQGASLWVSDEAPLTVAKIRSQCLALKQEHGLDFVCVDYAQLLSSTHKGSENEQLTQISKALKQLAMELDIAVISAAQLNRESTKENRPPKVSDLRGSGSLEQDADVVILLHHEVIDGQETGKVSMILDKNRTGTRTTFEEAWRPNRSKVGEWKAADVA